MGTIKTCATYPQQNRSLSYQSYSPTCLSGIPDGNAGEALIYNMPGEHKSHTYTNGVDAGGIEDCLEFADEDPSAHNWINQNQTKGWSSGIPMYYYLQRRCRRENCSFYGRPETENYCSCCYKEELKCRERESKVYKPG